MSTLFRLNHLCMAGLLAAAGAVSVAASAQVPGSIAEPEGAAQNAAEVFGRFAKTDPARLESTTHLVYAPDREAFTKTGEVAFVPKDYLVMMTGSLLRKAHVTYYVSQTELPQEMLATVNELAQEQERKSESVTAAQLEEAAGLVKGTLRRMRTVNWVYEEGVLGHAHVDAHTAEPWEITVFKRAAPELGMLAFDEAEAREIAQRNGARKDSSAFLIEPSEFVFAWGFTSPDEQDFVDARTGEHLTRDEMLTFTENLLRAELETPSDAGGLTINSMHPVFMEQGMHQAQGYNQCGPTSISILFDYFGERIHHNDVATVSTQTGATTWADEIDEAGMFSHNSNSLFSHGTNPVHSPLVGGYVERDYGYTAANGLLRHDPWSSLCELVNERCPFIANITGHYLVVIGYADDGGDSWVAVCNPADADANWVANSWRSWTSFSQSWAGRYYRFFVIRPIPVSLEFLPGIPTSASFTLRATVRTCHEFPGPELAHGERWDTVNRLSKLYGDKAGNNPLIPITVSYPQGVPLVSGASTQFWNPTGMEDSTSVEWVFAANGNEKAGDFRVECIGWAIHEDVYNHLYVAYGNLLTSINASQTSLQCLSASGTLATGVSKDGTTLPLTDASAFPPPPFLIRVDTEIMRVRAVNGNQFTVSRPKRDSYAAPHSAGATVTTYTEFIPVPFDVEVGDELMTVSAVNGNTFTVARGQAGTSAASHAVEATVKLHVANELYGWDALRIDDRLFRIANSQGETVAAIGDQGNLYLAGAKHEWEDPDDVEPTAGVAEFMVRNGELGNVGAIIDETGNLHTESLCHFGMDDVHDTCAVVNGNATEQDFLDNPDEDALMIKDRNGDVVAYIGAGPTTIKDPQSTTGWLDVSGDVRLKGKVFENWTNFGYWD